MGWHDVFIILLGAISFQAGVWYERRAQGRGRGKYKGVCVRQGCYFKVRSTHKEVVVKVIQDHEAYHRLNG
jgi:hypothetical protein